MSSLKVAKPNVKTEPGKGNRQRQQCRTYKKPIAAQPKFEGRCEELKGYIYDCSDGCSQAGAYTKITKEIAEYAGHTCRQSADIRKAIEGLELPSNDGTSRPSGKCGCDRDPNLGGTCQGTCEKDYDTTGEPQHDAFGNPGTVHQCHEGKARKILQNIQEADTHCNAGVTSTNLQGNLPGYGTVWFHPDGIANILSLTRVKYKYPVTYDAQCRWKRISHPQARRYREDIQGVATWTALLGYSGGVSGKYIGDESSR